MANKYDMESLFGETPSSTASGVTKKSKYDMDSLFGDRSDESKALDATVKANLRQSVKEDPLKIFKSKMLSEELGLPTDVVNRNLVEVDATARAQKWDAKLTNSPTLKRMMADPYFAGVAHKDEMLPEVESLFREKGFAAASKMQRMDEASRAERFPAMMRDWNRQRDFSYAKAFGVSFAGGIASLAPNLLTAVTENAAEVPASQLQLVPAGGSLLSLMRPFLPEAAKYFRGVSENVQRETEYAIGELPADATARGIAQGFISYGQNIPTLIAGVLTGQPEIGLGVLGAQVFGSEYMRGRKEGMAPAKATTFGGLQSATEYVTERVPFIKLIGDLGVGKDFAKTFLRNQFGEQIGEQVATVFNDAIDWAYLNPDKSVKEFLAERPSAAYQTAVATLVAGGGNVALATAIEKAGNFISSKEEKAKYVEEQAKAMEQLFGFANSSVLKGIDAKSFEQLVQAAADDNEGSPSDLYIDGNTFKQLLDQAGVDVNTMPNIATQLQDAIENGTDIIAPIGELTTSLSNTGIESQVLENLKFEQDGLTLAEARVAYEESKEAFKLEVDSALASQEEKNFFEQKADEIYQNIFTQLQEVKRNTKDANDLYAELIKQFYSTEAKQQSAATGSVVTPDIVFASLPALKVAGETISGKQVLTQESPEFKAWFGKSKAVDDNGKPLVVYHGTRDDIEYFDLDHPNRKDNGWLGNGVYTTDDVELANTYANLKKGDAEPNVMPLYIRVENPYNATLDEKQKLRGYSKKEVNAWTKKLKDAGHDGVILDYGNGTREIVAFDPKQVKSSVGNVGTYSRNTANLLNQSDLDTLVAQHNLTEDNLIFADKMGGLAVPSLAISKADEPLQEFGEITLIATKDVVDPKGYAKAKVFGADIYSARYPNVSYMFDREVIDGLNTEFNDGIVATGGRELSFDRMEDNPFQTLLDNTGVRYKFLKDNGIKPKIVYEKLSDQQQQILKSKHLKPYLEASSDPIALSRDADYVNAFFEFTKERRAAEGRDTVEITQEQKENLARNGAYDIKFAVAAKGGTVDVYLTRSSIDNQFDSKLVEKFRDYVENILDSIGADEKIRQGYTPSGSRRYIDHTLENVVKILKKGLRGGENWNYGLGSVRAHYAPQFKSVSDIQKNKDRIIGKNEFENIKSDMDYELEVLAESLSQYHIYSGSVLDNLTTALSSAAKTGISKALDESGFENVPVDIKESVAGFLDKLRNMPTEYFEVKILRDVSIAEFSAAVVPKNISKKAIGVLKKHGIKQIEYYDQNEDGSRVETIGKLSDFLFQEKEENVLGTFDPDQFIISLKKGANLSTFLHETGHFFLEAKIKLATQEGARKQLIDDVNAAMKWMGVDLASWNNMNLDEKRPYHEKWARGFEAYLFEGNAPSVELKSAFQRFADWLKSIYQSVSKLLSDNNVQLTPEVRSVMDRMLATDEQIEEAKKRRGFMALFNTAEEADMSAEEFFDYQAQLTAVTQEAKELMTKRSLADIKYLRRARDKFIRNFQKEGEEKRREARMDARREVMSQPLYRAWSFLTARDWGKVSAKEKQSTSLDPSRDSLFVAIAKLGGINRDAAISEWGIDPADIKNLAPLFGKPVFRKEGGMTIDGMAENLSQFGYIVTDENGKYDLTAFEDLIMDELSGSPQYSIAYDYTADQQDIVEGEMRDLAQQLPAGRLNLDEVKAMYGQNFQAVQEKLGRMLSSDGLSADIVAELFTNEDGSAAFGNGKEMIDAMMAAMPPQMAIEDLTDKLVLERHGDITSEKAAQQAADEALHNEAMLRSAATEMKAITGMTGSARDMARAAKDAAALAVNKIKVKDLRPSKYIAAANKAGKEADAAIKAKKPQEAAAAKRRQMINLAMVQRAYEVQNDMRVAMKAFSAVNKADKKLAKTMDINLVETARSVLASYGLNNADPRLAMDNLSKIKAYNPELYNTLEPIVTAATISSRDENNNPVNYQQLSIGDFFALRDTVAQLTQQARQEKVITNKGIAVDIEEVNTMLTAQLLANGYQVEEIGKSIAPSEKDQRKWTLSSIKAAMRRMEHWVSMQDMNDFKGNFRSFLFQEVQDGNTKYMSVKNYVLRHYIEMLRAKEAEGDFRTTKIAATELGYTFTGKQELLGALLHTGNESNKRKLLVGRGWGEMIEGADKTRTLDTRKWDSFINRMISEGVLTKSDYDFLQATWDLMDSLKEDAQKAHYRLNGFYFDEVTATPFQNQFGSYKGGYAPAKADSDLVLEADLRQDINQIESDFNFLMPSTGNGFTKGRVEYNKPLVMDLRLVAQHIDQVLRYTYLQPAIADVLKIIKRGEFVNTLNAVDKGALKSMILPWLQRVATQSTSAPFQSDAGKKTAKFWQGLRRNTGINIMTANMVNALQQMTGLSMAAVKVEPRYLKSAQVRYMKAPNEVANSITLMSDWMKARLENQAFDMQTQMQEIMLGTTKAGRAADYVRNHAYFMQRAMQNYVDIVTWSAAYDKAISEGKLNEEESVKYADSVVRETQSSLLPVDISTVEAGNAFFQLFTQFMNYFNMQANLLGTNFVVNAKQYGFTKKGLGKLFYVYVMGFMLPAVMADAIVRTFGWDWDDEDDDGYLDEFMAWFVGSQVRTATAMVPFLGNFANATFYKFNNKFYDDRITTSPAVSMLDQASAAPSSIYDAIMDEGSVKKAVKDTLTLIGLITGIPVAALGRPAGYIIDWEEGKVEPESTADLIRGLASGKGREEERQ